MASQKPSSDFIKNITALTGPAQCLNEIVQAWTEYLRIAEEEKTKRCEITAAEKATLAKIQAKRDFLISYLEHSFDERAKNFRSLFQVADQAILSGDNQQLGLALQAVIELAKSNPFQNLADLSTVKAALDDPDHVWEV